MKDALPTFRHAEIPLIDAGLSFAEMPLRGEMPAWLPDHVCLAPIVSVFHNHGTREIGLARLCRERGVSGLYARITIVDDGLRRLVAAQGPRTNTVTPVWGRDGSEVIYALSVNTGIYREALGSVQ